MPDRVYGSMNRIMARKRPIIRQSSDYVGCVCGKRFSSTTEQRNCHMCGEVYCSECTKKSILLPQLHYSQPTIVCDTCHVLYQMASMSKQELMKLPVKWLLFYVYAFDIFKKGDIEKETIVEKIERTPVDDSMMKKYWDYPSYYDSRRKAFLPKPQRKTITRERFSRSPSTIDSDGFFGFFLNPFELFQQGFEWASDAFGGSMDVENHRAEPSATQQQRPPSSFPSSHQPPRTNSQPAQAKAQPKASHQLPVLTIEELVRQKRNIQELNVSTLKAILNYNAVEHRNIVEKHDLVALVIRLCDEYRTNRERIERGETPADIDICKICFDHQINCVFLECGHMATCIECARQLFECPICRQPIHRVIHTFRT
jgi:hypothetical protein